MLIELKVQPIKLYCYVDETGQDISAHQGRTPFFAVSVVVTNSERAELERICEYYETVSKKGKFKWGKAEAQRRLEYLRLILEDKRFASLLRVVVFGDVQRKFDEATYTAIAYAIRHDAPPDYKAYIYVDALAHDKRTYYRKGLHRFGIPTGEIKGIARDESSALIRLADAVAGATRDTYEAGNEQIKLLLADAKVRGQVIVIEV